MRSNLDISISTLRKRINLIAGKGFKKALRSDRTCIMFPRLSVPNLLQFAFVSQKTERSVSNSEKAGKVISNTFDGEIAEISV